MERPSGRLTGIYILSSAICVSELCRVTVARRIRSRKSVIITRAAVLALSISLVLPAARSSGGSADKERRSRGGVAEIFSLFQPFPRVLFSSFSPCGARSHSRREINK